LLASMSTGSSARKLALHRQLPGTSARTSMVEAGRVRGSPPALALLPLARLRLTSSPCPAPALPARARFRARTRGRQETKSLGAAAFDLAAEAFNGELGRGRQRRARARRVVGVDADELLVLHIRCFASAYMHDSN
jgi:hypothetical protein